MKRLIFPLLMLLGFVDAKAGNGDWRIYAAYHDAQKVVSLHNRVYVLSDGGLYSYDPEDTSVDTYTKANTLSDHNIYDIEACESTGELVIIYTNGNIDLLNANGDAYSMPDLKLKSLSDKTLNNVLIDGTTLYVSTNSGVVLVNLRNHTFGNFYSFGHKINDIALDANNMYAATADGVYVGKLSDNLLDKNNWKSLSNLVALDFITFSGSIYATTKNALLKVTDNTSFSTSSIASAKPSSCYICNGNLFYLVNGSLYSIDASGSTQNYGSQSINYLSYSQSTYWAACGESGLIGYTLGGNSFTVKTASVIPNSPHRNFSYQMKMIDNKRLLMTGGAFNYPEVLRAGSVMKYEGNKWSFFDEAGPKEALGNNDWYINVTDVVQDRNDSSHHFVSAACSGLFEFKGGKLIKNYSYNNSPLTTIIPTSRRPGYYVRITGLAFDSQNNLWMCNNECDTIVRIRKADGSWTSFYIPEIASYPTFDHVVFDRRGWAWINSRRSTSAGHQAGVIIVNTNNNPGSPSGFSYKFITTIKNQDGTTYSPTLFSCMTEDVDGYMWVGCSSGIFVSYAPANVFNNDFYFTQVKVPRNDGTNLADYLLSEVPIKCITIDGGNRKWIGTNGSGVFLVSADGLETIEHFTTENSPLISDDIYDIQINGETGEVFIATDAGLVSFFGDATDPAASLDKNNVLVYPNPVRPEYAGNISITGLAYDTNVKIVNAAGKLVNEGTSVGGEYTWNGRLASGKKCTSGVYYVLAADSEGKKGVVTKFLMVRE